MNQKATGLDQWLVNINLSAKAERLFIQVVRIGTLQYFIDALSDDVI